MSWRSQIRRTLERLGGKETPGLPGPVAEELAEMVGADPVLAAALERRRDRGRRPREEVYARYGYLLFIPTTR